MCKVRFGCLFLDKSCFVAPRVDWIRRFLKAAALLVDTLVAIHDEVTACVGASLSRERSFIVGTGRCREFPFSVHLLPSALEERWPFWIIGAHFLQVADLHFIELCVVVSSCGAVKVLWSLKAVWASEVHGTKNTHAARGIGSSLREAAAGFDALIFSCHAVQELAERARVIEAVLALSDVSQFALASHVSSFLVEERLGRATFVAVRLALESWVGVVTAQRVEQTFATRDVGRTALLAVGIACPELISWGIVTTIGKRDVAVARSKRSVANWVVVEEVQFSVATAFSTAVARGIVLR